MPSTFLFIGGSILVLGAAALTITACYPRRPSSSTSQQNTTNEETIEPFQYGLCHQRFSKIKNLNRHYRSLHADDLPFECQYRGKKFLRSYDLWNHQRTHRRRNIDSGNESGSHATTPASVDAN
jgi:uncharacterized Zn-finger protein